MAHEITDTDGLVLVKERAWHGLGMVIPQGVTPTQALPLAGLEWGVEQRPLYSEISVGGEIHKVELPTHVANYRSDTKELLGVVSKSYVPVENAALAEFCEAIGNENEVVIETVGSIRGGKKIWFLLQGDSFEVMNGDEIFPYILVSNGHDGWTNFRVTPTSVRVVCSNTLHMVIPGVDTGSLTDSAFTCRHTTNVIERVEEVKAALAHYKNRLKLFRESIDVVAKKEMTTEKLATFFAECYQADFGLIVENPTTRSEESAKKRSVEAFSSFMHRFDDEKEVAGATAWNAVNAYSGVVQHDKKTRGKDDVKRVESRLDSNVFGLNQQRTIAAWLRAFAV